MMIMKKNYNINISQNYVKKRKMPLTKTSVTCG